MVLVQGGTLPAGSALANQTVSAFHIARFETTWAEWKKVRTWAAANGYDIGTAGQGSADNHPVRNVSWYDAVKWCNAKSQMEGFMPVYSVNGTTYKTGEAVPTTLSTANGYRLPAEAEWEWAARGGTSSSGYTYSGSNDINAVGWYLGNSNGASANLQDGRGTWPVGQKTPNELGTYDMSGNVAEWCWNIVDGTAYRWIRGGSWRDQSESETVVTRLIGTPANRGSYVGFRYARNVIGDMVTVQGGTLPAGSGLANQTIQAFQIGRTEVTWGEWKTVRTWAAANGYTDLANVGEGSADNHPVRNVNWYDVVKWSNAKSQMEGIVPVYSVNGTTYKSGQNIPILNTSANGYRLVFDAEWEWAARGGILSAGLTYSGSNELNSVAWYRGNSNGAFVDLGTNYGGSGYSGRGTWPVGLKVANELGVFDMSGNVLEWCFDDTSGQRAIRGSDWATDATDCRLGILRGPTEPTWSGKNAGFRLARNIGPKISISGTLPEAMLNQAYAGYTFGAVGSTGNKTWSISEGTLPPGISFSANGTLSGTPTTAGTYTFVIRVESGGYRDEIEVVLEVVASGLKDSDNDGVNDYRETYDGTNPNDPQSFDPLSIGLVAHYPFDGNANDETKNGYDATGANLVFAQDRNGASNSCLALTAPFATSKKIYLASTANRTFSEWVKVVEFPAKTSGAWGPKPNADFAVFPQSVIIGNNFSADGQWWMDTGDGVAFYNIVTSSQWKHLTVVYQGDVSKAKVFLNGVPLPLNRMVFGKVAFDSGEYAPIKFDPVAWNTLGLSSLNLIDNVRVYNRALSDAEVAQLYAKETGGANMVTVQGGTLPASSGLAGQSVASFRIGKYEVTWDEWQAVRTWALANGYTDLANIGAGSASNHPVRHVNWYDVVKWCNAKSQMEGLTPVYQFSGAIYKTGQSEPTVNTAANGYRLPLEKEWEWAALGGVYSKGFSYSGSNDINAVAWYASNSGLDTKPAGLKTANELMIFDMSGNVAEWCWGTANPRTSPRGGGCLDSPIGNFTPGSLNPDVRALQFGFRVVRNATSAYQFVPGKFTWLQAKEDAISKGGHLATITSQAENNQVKEWLGANYNKDLFIGAFSTNADGKWQWVTGEEFNFSNWDTASYRKPVDLTWPAPHNAHKFANKETWDDVSYGFNAVDGYILERPSP
jgi:formylglycine-generating enzyme required for sulfatase activity